MIGARTHWGIRLRLWIAAALPALLVVVLLLAGFLDRHGRELTEALTDRARASTQQLAGAAEFPLFTGNDESLLRLVDAALAGDTQMRGAALIDADGTLRVQAGTLSRQMPPQAGLPAEGQSLTDGDSLVVVMPVRLLPLPLNDLLTEPVPGQEGDTSPRIIGFAMVELSLATLHAQQRDLLVWTLAITVLGLLSAGLVSVVIAASVTRPIEHISSVVTGIAQGEFKARVDPERAGVLAGLGANVNRMAEQVGMTQETLRQQVEVATEELRQQRDAAERAARTDSLTGVASRGAFTEAAEAEIQRALRYRQPLCMVLIDLDHFKTVNDTHGHASGDAVLASFARTILREVREVDLIGRLGGEEFAVLLPNISAGEAVQVADRMRDAVARSELRVNGQPLHYTASFGVAEFDPRELSLSSLLSRADSALYDAKRRGRNRVELAV